MLEQLILENAVLARVPKEEYPQRVYRILKNAGFQPDGFAYIHITGSKGKGSIARSCFELLKNSGKKAALFTSPHIFDIRERFETSEGLIPEQKLLDLYDTYSELFKREGLHFFEICLFLALASFEQEKCLYVVLEVGVGGRYDPTNFCTPLVSLLGHISLEHKNLLGNTLEQIAYDKAGIIKSGVPAFSVPQQKSVRNILEKEGSIHFIDWEWGLENDSAYLFYQDQKIFLNRIGKAHIRNFQTALAGISKILPNLSLKAVQDTAAQKIAYRMDRINKDLLIDTAHNGASFENLLDTLEHWLHWSEITLCLTIIKGKEIEEICSVISRYGHIIKNIIVFDFDKEKSDGKRLFDMLKEKSPDISYQKILKEIPTDRKLVFAGSFYSIKEINRVLKQHKII